MKKNKGTISAEFMFLAIFCCAKILYCRLLRQFSISLPGEWSAQPGYLRVPSWLLKLGKPALALPIGLFPRRTPCRVGFSPCDHVWQEGKAGRKRGWRLDPGPEDCRPAQGRSEFWMRAAASLQILRPELSGRSAGWPRAT